MKTWKLDSQQYVSADYQRYVYFQHCNKRNKQGKWRGITLSWRQFLNLNDIIKDLNTFKNMKYYPLGKYLWLQFHKTHIQFYHCRLNRYFTFHNLSWSKYVKETHRHILSFLRHEATTLHDCQQDATHETVFESESQDITSTFSGKHALYRTTYNVGGENEQWQKSSNLSEWDCSNLRRPFSFCREVNALRTTTAAASDVEEGEVSDIRLDCGQSSDFVSIE